MRYHMISRDQIGDNHVTKMLSSIQNLYCLPFEVRNHVQLKQLYVIWCDSVRPLHFFVFCSGVLFLSFLHDLLCLHLPNATVLSLSGVSFQHINT